MSAEVPVGHGSFVLEQQFLPAPQPAKSRILLGTLLIVFTLPAAVIGAAAVWLPHRVAYRTGPQGVTVVLDRGVWVRERHFSREQVAGIEAVELPPGSKRVGTNLPGYCVGTFVYRGLGSVWQAGNCSRSAVLLRQHGEPERVVLTPQDRAEFLAAWAEGQSASFHPKAVPADGVWLGLKLLVLLPLPALLVLPLLFLVAPAKLRYAVGGGWLEVRTVFGRRRVAVAGATARPIRPGRCFKVMGSAFPGYYTGSFRLDGVATKVYATSLREGVLVAGQQRVFVTPADGASFLAALSEQGASVDKGELSV
ncbi:MAG: hypothetical protein HXY19_01925 [Thermoanaerobaculaceae bacterium]|nr:hypothetical protein [Thermoanaerobaculaceae bacterium]